ncbi:hypothetical protein [Streptomyces sp. enrichment culture]|uniref:hypothetical protein n=1 Tax=Streptomyces sp. enrichment culture TaxID=1795815 RepID=UPI003F55C7A6
MGVSPYSTGGGGTVLEHRYAAVLLSSLLTRGSLDELGDPVLVPVEIKLQASQFSKVDDILITARPSPGGEDFSVCIGVRRDPEIVPSSEATVALIGSFLWEISEHWQEVQQGRYRLVLAVAERNVHAHEVASLAQIAAGRGPDQFRAEAARSGPTNEKVRARLCQLDEVVTAAATARGLDTTIVSAKELTWRLLSALRVQHIRLEGGDERDRTQAVDRLRDVAAEDATRAAEEVMSRIEHLVGDWAPTAAQVTEAMLRRHLAARLKPRFLSLGGNQQLAEVEPDALLRGPIAHLGLAEDLKEAQALEECDPAAAAVRFARVADALESSAWVPFALAVRQQQAKAHHKAGEHTAGVAAGVAVLAAALPSGEVWRAVSVSQRLATDQIEAPDELIRAANALGDLAAYEHFHQVTLDEVCATIDALRVSDPHCVLATTWFAEHATATGRLDLLRPREEALSSLAATATQSDALLQARLRACLADLDLTGTAWTTLAQSARADFPRPITALLTARHGRFLATHGQAQKALDRYDDAIERAVQCSNHQDAAAWTEAHNLVRIRYGLQGDKIGEAYPTATALRAAGSGSALPQPFSARERALGRVANQAHPAETLQALTQYLRQATVSAAWLEEREAHEILGRVHLDNGEPVAAVSHFISAGADKALESLSGRLPEEPLSLQVPEDLPDQPRWRRHGTFIAVQAAADLLPDDDARTWADAALTEIADEHPVPFETRNPRQAAFGAFARLADASSTAQAQRFLDVTFRTLDSRTRRHRTTDEAYTQALISIAQRHSGLLQVEAVDRISHGLLIDAFMANTVLGQGEAALRLQPSVVSERCTMAASGNADAAQALILAEAPADAGRPLARAFLDRALGRSGSTDPDLTATPAQAALLIGHLLQSAEWQSFANAMTARVRSHDHTAHERQDALDALAVLATYLGPEQRARPFEAALEAARGRLDGSAQDDLASTSSYDRFQLNMGLTTLRCHGLATAAHLASTDADAQRIIELALPLLAQAEGSAERLTVEALAKLSPKQHVLLPAVLAGHSAERVRALAARLWCTTERPSPADLGARLAVDPSPRVRWALADDLSHGESHAAVREMLRGDCRRSVRTAVAALDSRSSPGVLIE